MTPTERLPARGGRTILSCALIALAASAAMAAAPQLGESVPDLSLPALGTMDLVLSERDGPTVLVFFRGSW